MNEKELGAYCPTVTSLNYDHSAYKAFEVSL
jgi:hypothetical protein